MSGRVKKKSRRRKLSHQQLIKNSESLASLAKNDRKKSKQAGIAQMAQDMYLQHKRKSPSQERPSMQSDFATVQNNGKGLPVKRRIKKNKR